MAQSASARVRVKRRRKLQLVRRTELEREVAPLLPRLNLWPMPWRHFSFAIPGLLRLMAIYASSKL